jgi:NTE family protein
MTDEAEDDVALCLSGGGYRAMLFHVGSLWRLNELGYLPRLARVSSVSGGSITAAVLALHWSRLTFDAGGVAPLRLFQAAVVEPLRGLAAHTVDQPAILGGLLSPRATIADKVAGAYRDHLFGDATLQDLPAAPAPLFVINATNLMTGALWRFSRPLMADWTVGKISQPRLALATAVAASSAFPPFLSPLRLDLDPSAWDADGRDANFAAPFTERAVLTDGGVYDNMGLETVWKNHKTVLVSDGGGKMAAKGRVAGDWGRQSYRVNQVIDNQVRSLRKRHIQEGYQRRDRAGTYWGIRVNTRNYGPPAGALDTPVGKTTRLADVKTRLKKMAAGEQERLINWGYAACDVGMRRWVEPNAAAPAGFPYPRSGVG